MLPFSQRFDPLTNQNVIFGISFWYPFSAEQPLNCSTGALDANIYHFWLGARDYLAKRLEIVPKILAYFYENIF